MANTEVAIIGGGLVGMSLALALGHGGIDCTLIDGKAVTQKATIHSDGRTTALSFTTVKALEVLGVWDKLKTHAGAIHDIRIVDGASHLALHFNHKAVSREPMGYIVENPRLREALVEAVKASAHITIRESAPVEHITFSDKNAKVAFHDGEFIEAPLAVLAVGKQGKLVDQLRLKHISRDYGQTAIIFTLKHSEPHNQVALERFLPGGPFAVLPLAGGHHSGIVWTEKQARAEALMALGEAAFLEAFKVTIGSYLGEVEMASQRHGFPVSVRVPLKLTAKRLAMAGDAAHAIHPIAGQGFNLGMRDAALLAQLVVEHARLGLDIGSQTVLDQYSRSRMPDILSMIAATDSLNRLFSNRLTPLTLTRRLGLATVEKIPVLKNQFMRHAMGMIPGHIRLLEGERL